MLVVQGDHDQGDYRPARINRIPGCTEMSGRAVTVDGRIILGIGARQAAFLRVLRELTAAWRNRTDLVVSHVSRRRLPLVTALRPRRLLVQGHSETGLQRQDGVLIAGTVSLPLVIDVGPRGALRIQPADPGGWWCPWGERDEALACG